MVAAFANRAPPKLPAKSKARVRAPVVARLFADRPGIAGFVTVTALCYGPSSV